MLAERDDKVIVNIFKVGPALLDNLVESFSINLDAHKASLGAVSFSPATYRICITHKTLFALDVQSSMVLLQENGPFYHGCLSPDGSLLVASRQDGKTSIWKYTSKGYILWRGLLNWGDSTKRGYQFSPTSSLILISSGSYLEAQQLEDLTIDPSAEAYFYYGEFSTDGTYIVTVNIQGQLITITNLCGNFSQLIDTQSRICGLVLTGNVLLVQGEDGVIAWKLTVEGTVDGVWGIRTADRSDSLWTKLRPEGCYVTFGVEGQIGAIWDSKDLTCYSIETGEKFEVIPPNAPSLLSGKWFCDSLDLAFEDQHSFNYHRFTNYDNPSKDNTIPCCKEGWVKYPEAEYPHQFWLPVHWRPIWSSFGSGFDWSEGHWLNDVMALRLNTSFGLAVIKF